MSTISEIQKEYCGKIDQFDLELLIANTLGKSREFVLIHSEHELTPNETKKLKSKISRRISSEPIAHIFGHKEFFGLNFKVNKHTLIPRPETEMIVEQVLDDLKVKQQNSKVTIADIGTGSGCIIISIANTLKQQNGPSFYASDTSIEAIKVAQKNAKLHGVNGKIKFLNGNLLSPILMKLAKLKANKLIITANLPYLSASIYNSAPVDVKKFEPKSSLYSAEHGLWHYRKLLEQINKILTMNSKLQIVAFFEISPEQKPLLSKLIKSILPQAKMHFTKDLAGKWRVCEISI